MKLFYLFFLLIIIYLSYGIPNQRTRCAIECYSSCAFSGTKQALSCNCTLQVLSASNCTSVDEDMLSTELESSDSISVWSQYISAHAIQIKIQSFPSAFIYIFEYTPTNNSISDEDKEWSYGGSSSTPTISFSISDICQEYQFRVIIILKTSDPTKFIKVFSPINIPQQLPSMDISPDKISIQLPQISNDGKNITTSFSWALPNGYMNYDIFGYESPQAYSINCFSNSDDILIEDEYEKPSVEVLRSGGGMMIWSLPIEYFIKECRIWMEVKMIPRCSKIEATDISTSIDLDCDSFPKLSPCNRKNKISQCIDVIDVWGEGKKTNIHWQMPSLLNNDEKFFHIIYGKAQQSGAFPYNMWKIDNFQEKLVNITENHLIIDVESNIPYAVQVCTTKNQSSIKTGTEKIGYVIPFICSYCQMRDKIIDSKYCLECQKIEKRMPTFNAICPKDNFCNISTKLIHNNKVENSKDLKVITGDTRQINDEKKNEKQFNITKNGFGVITDLSFFTKNSPESSGRQFDTKTIYNIPPIPIHNNDTGIQGTIQAVEAKAIVLDKVNDNIFTSTIKLDHFKTINIPSNFIHNHGENVSKDKIHIIEVEQKFTTTTESITSIQTTTTQRTTTKIPYNMISQIHSNNLHQGPCRMRSGIICEYGCRSEASCICPSFQNTSCIRGLYCPPIPDVMTYYNQTTNTINIVDKTFFNNIINNTNFIKTFTNLYIEISESTKDIDIKRIYKNIDLKDGKKIIFLNTTGIQLRIDNNINYKKDAFNNYLLNICLYNNTIFKNGPSIYYNKLTPIPFATIKDYMNRYQNNSIQILSEDTFKTIKNKQSTEIEEPKVQTSWFIYLLPIIFVIIITISLLIYYCFVKRYQRLGNVAFYNTVNNPLRSTLQLSAYRPTIEHLPNEYYINTLDINNILPRVKIPTNFNDHIYHENGIQKSSTSYINGSFERDSQEVSLTENSSLKIDERKI
ncbi:Hypothetical protein SRAE_1000058700 [Strongyloides ratti]|uniref:Fibronectin type-III domain-containing protein n=1 Tax=Strongyloides ratti TaxID=34506 RepID=A0A090L4B9_STRRB|nr:Hypothetical protein SRAE_1000058700 [Strongyloides ratti]CEF62314.1 Hypothetical protein SRAE_1000058700 [Strongyloides ratti]